MKGVFLVRMNGKYLTKVQNHMNSFPSQTNEETIKYYTKDIKKRVRLREIESEKWGEGSEKVKTKVKEGRGEWIEREKRIHTERQS